LNEIAVELCEDVLVQLTEHAPIF